MSNVIPPAIQDALDRIAEKIEGLSAIEKAMSYIRCRRSGGSMEECLGIYRLGSPPPGDPFFEELLNNVEATERCRLLTVVKNQLLEEVKRIDNRLLDPGR